MGLSVLSLLFEFEGAEGSGEPAPRRVPQAATSQRAREGGLMAAAKLNADRLRREMLLRGWNGVDLAFHSGISPATVSHAMCGLSVSTGTIRKMAIALSKAAAIEGAAELLA